MASGCPDRPMWQWLAILVLVAWGAGVALAPSQAQPPCLGTEDGRCLPAPAQVEKGPRLAAGAGSEDPDRSPSAPQWPAALVRRRDAVSTSRFAALLRDDGHTGARGLGLRGWWRVSPAPGETMEALLARLRAMPEVACVEEDTCVQASYLPNDAYLGDQWALPAIAAVAAWDRTLGDDDVWIAVVDSGVDDTHADAPADLWWGWDFANDDNDPWDDNGHGTHVAGIAAAATDNAHGVAGLCPECDVLAVKVLTDDGRGWNSDVADGIAFAAYWGHDYGKRTIINVSLGGGYSYAVAEAVAYAQGLGALVVAAAGNDGPTAPDYPAALDGVLAVTATDENDAPAGFSQYGDIAAPGVDILSTVPSWCVAPDMPPYQSWSGTSMASPMVAGAAGLVWSRAPSLSAPEVSGRLLANVEVPVGWNPAYGAGRLNVARALSPDPTPTPTFTATPEPTSTNTPEPTPTLTPTPVPSATPTATPETAPTVAPPTIPAPTATTIVALPGAPTPEPYVLTLPLLMLER
jgi:thermitase